MKIDKMYSLDEIALLPSSKPTDINSRSEVDPYVNGKLPIFVSPMTCIINEENFHLFKKSKFIPVIPRGILPYDITTGDWIAVSLKDFNDIMMRYDLNKMHILIDIANGHMKSLYDSVRKAKAKYSDVVIMVGNIAHPDMYLECMSAGVDFCRFSIGLGAACITGCLTGISASQEYLLRKIRDIKSMTRGDKHPKIIMDGGLNTIDRAIKCLALGADYVMMGRMFAECQEACGLWVSKMDKKRKYYGMASKQGQIDLYGKVIHEPEGVEIIVKVDKTLDSFASQFEAALRSAMSYTGCHTLEEFKNNVKYSIQSIAEFNNYYKR